MAVGRINEVAALTGFSYEKIYGRFAGKKISAVIKSRIAGRNNEVTVRRGSTVAIVSRGKEKGEKQLIQ